MTPEQVTLIKLSFAPVIGRKREVAKVFYQRLFETSPELKAMFKADMEAQAEKFMSTVGAMIGSLQDRPAFIAILENLGRKHVGYGVRDEHYDKVGNALLWTLEQTLGDAFTNEARKAWSSLYETVANVMRQAANATTSSAERALRAGAR